MFQLKAGQFQAWAAITNCPTCSFSVGGEKSPECGDYPPGCGEILAIDPTGEEVCSPGVGTLFLGGGNSLSSKSLENISVPRSMFGPDSLEVHGLEVHHCIRQTALRDRSFRKDGKPTPEKLKAGLIRKIEKRNLTLAEFIDEGKENPEYLKNGRLWYTKFLNVCEFLGVTLDKSDHSVTWEFATNLTDEFEKYEQDLRSGELSQGNFCSKVIDSCVRDGAFWPPTFTEHRNTLRGKEREAEGQA
jgi:hypothetical protein